MKDLWLQSIILIGSLHMQKVGRDNRMQYRRRGSSCVEGVEYWEEVFVGKERDPKSSDRNRGTVESHFTSSDLLPNI